MLHTPDKNPRNFEFFKNLCQKIGENCENFLNISQKGLKYAKKIFWQNMQKYAE